MKRILVIDDDHHILGMIKRMLEHLDLEILLAPNGEKGLELFEKYQVDLVITDIVMPEKEGLEIIREMKKNSDDLNIIAMSGGGRISAASYLDTALMFGAREVIEKPFTRKQLISAVERMPGMKD